MKKISVKESIEQKLKKAFDPTFMDVKDVSHKHHGHAGNPHGQGSTHFDITIHAMSFAGKSRVESHRMIYDVLADELAGPVHALAIHIQTTT